MSSNFLIIGGGVIGLSIARELHKQGATGIIILDKSRCGGEASWAAAGMLGVQAEADGTGPFFDLCSASRDLYPPLAAELLDETGIDIELDREGTIYLGFSAEDGDELLRRYRIQHDLGLAVELLSQEEVVKAEPYVSATVQIGLMFAADWQVDNRKLCTALTTYARMNGIEVREDTAVDSLIVENGRVRGAMTTAGPIHADRTVLATGAWTSLIKIGDPGLPFVVEPVRGQMIALQLPRRLFRHVIYSPRGYIVPRADGRVLAGSTSERVGFATEVTESAELRLRAMAGEISPFIADVEPIDKWAGLRPFVGDGSPVLGPVDGYKDLVIATGHYRNGILLAPVTAKLAVDHLVNGAASEYFTTFGPGRFGVRDAAAG